MKPHNTYLIAAVSLISLTGCTSMNYDSANQDTSTAKVITGTRAQVEKATFIAIKKSIPGTKISRIADEEMAYGFYAQPFLDRTEFEITFKPVIFDLKEQHNLSGYTYSFKAKGTNFSPDARWGKDIRKSFETEVQKQGGNVLNISKFDLKQ